MYMFMYNVYAKQQIMYFFPSEQVTLQLSSGKIPRNSVLAWQPPKRANGAMCTSAATTLHEGTGEVPRTTETMCFLQHTGTGFNR